MYVERRGAGDSGTLIDVLDRVLDKGIVIDGWARVSVAGIDLVGLEMHVVVASIETHLRYADALGLGLNGRTPQSQRDEPLRVR